MTILHLRGSWMIRAPRAEIYAIISDFESMPKNFPSVAQSLTITEQQGNNLTMKAVAKSFGLAIPVTMKTVLRPPLGFVSDNTNPVFRATGHEEFLMEEIPEGTLIHYSYDYDISRSPWILRLIAKPLFQWFSMWFWRRAVIDKIRLMVEKNI